MAETTSTSSPSLTDQLVDSLKAPFVTSAEAPAAKSSYTAIIYGVLGLLIGRSL